MPLLTSMTSDPALHMKRAHPGPERNETVFLPFLLTPVKAPIAVPLLFLIWFRMNRVTRVVANLTPTNSSARTIQGSSVRPLPRKYTPPVKTIKQTQTSATSLQHPVPPVNKRAPPRCKVLPLRHPVFKTPPPAGDHKLFGPTG